MEMPARSISYFSVLAFLASLHAYLTLYINSSVIASEPLGVLFITPIYILAAVFAIVLFFYSSIILSRIGNAWFLTLACGIEGATLFQLGTSPHGLLLFGALCIHLTMAPLIGLSLDIFFEKAMLQEDKTGTARGFFLTSGNTALVLSPLIVGILAQRSFSVVYLTSMFVLIIFLLYAIRVVWTFRDPVYNKTTLRGVLATFRGPLGSVTLSQLVLRIFYAFAAIYMPLLLISRGFTWGQIGIILGIALLPFMLFELPLGHMADKFLGEKEVLIAGFIILACATTMLTLSLPFSLFVYALIFFITRTGASMVEITTETNFFRNVTSADASAITLFRMTTAIGTLIGAGIGAFALFFLSLSQVFLIFGLFVLLGIPSALQITDSR